MLKIKLKKNELIEASEKEISLIDFIESGEQFPNIFGNKQRIVIDSGKLTSPEQVSKSIENEIEKSYVKNLLKTLISLVTNLSVETKDNKYVYGINLESGSVIKMYDYTIPAGPRQGEKIQRVEKIKLRDLQNIFIKAIKLIREQSAYPDYDKDIKKIFPVVNPKFEKYLNDPEEFVLYILRKSMPAIEDETSEFRNARNLFSKKMFETAKKPMDALVEALSLINELVSENVIVISRSPIDLLRMSDFPGIQSCHSPPRAKRDASGNIVMRGKEKQVEGQYFDCAVQESKNNGAVAFLLPKRTIEQEKDRLQDRELFKDLERPKIQGSTPMQRIRLRRYLHKPTKTELLAPEKQIYGSNPSDPFLQELINWSRKVQSSEIARVKSKIKQKVIKDENRQDKVVDYLDLSDFILIGGSYSDTPTEEIMQNFLQIEIDVGEGGDTYEDARVSEKILKAGSFKKEIVRLTNISDSSGIDKIEKNMDSKTIEQGDSIVHTLRYYPDPIILDKKIVNQTKNEAGLLSNLAKSAIDQSIKANIDGTKTAYNIRTPTYNGLANTLKFVIEITLSVPKNGNFSNEDIGKIVEVAHLIRLLAMPKEKFEKEFHKFLKEETDKHFIVKEQFIRTRKYYLRG